MPANDPPDVPPTEAVMSAESAMDAPIDGRAAFGDFGADITVIRDWPARSVVVVGRRPHPQVSATVNEVGFTPVLMDPEQASGRMPELVPFTFMILSPDVFDGDESVELVREWHSCSPSARLELAYPGRAHDPAVLLRAIRAGVSDVVDPTDPPSLEASIRFGMRRAGASRERVLAIGAHPGDVEIGCGATLLDHRRRGDRISILTLSRGVGGDKAMRLAEAASTADFIGAQLLFGDLPATAIEDGITTIRQIESVVQAIDPTVVYVHSPHDDQQDHRAVSTATCSATRGVPRVLGYQSPSATDDFLPSRFVEIDAALQRKLELLQMSGSPDGRSYLEPEPVRTGAPHRARHAATGARYAEPFEVLGSVATAPTESGRSVGVGRGLAGRDVRSDGASGNTVSGNTTTAGNAASGTTASGNAASGNAMSTALPAVPMLPAARTPLAAQTPARSRAAPVRGATVPSPASAAVT